MTVVDVGVRNGPLPMFLKLPDVHIVGYEPDSGECYRLSKEFPDHTFLPWALDSEPRERVFYLTVDLQCCSFYRPIEMQEIPQHRITGSRVVKTTTLDLQPVRPEVLKLDTQGSELDILWGAEEMLKSVQVLITEVEFKELYEGQPLFPEVSKFMYQRGFEFVRQKDAHYFHGEPYWADAWYARPGADPIIKMLEAA